MMIKLAESNGEEFYVDPDVIRCITVTKHSRSSLQQAPTCYLFLDLPGLTHVIVNGTVEEVKHKIDIAIKRNAE